MNDWAEKTKRAFCNPPHKQSTFHPVLNLILVDVTFMAGMSE